MAHFRPPGKLTRHLPPFPVRRQVEERQERAADPPALTHTTHPFCLPLSLLPLPLLARTPAHLGVSLQDGSWLSRYLQGWMDATLGFSSRNPLARSCRFAFPSPPSPQPNAAAGKQKTGERGGKCRAAHPPPQRGLRFLWEGRRGGLALRERGERAEMGRDVLAGLDKCPGIPPLKSFPFSAAAFLRGIHGELNPIVLGASCHRLPSIRQAGIREATGKCCLSHPECPTVGSSRPTSCPRDTNKKFCNP